MNLKLQKFVSLTLVVAIAIVTVIAPAHQAQAFVFHDPIHSALTAVNKVLLGFDVGQNTISAGANTTSAGAEVVDTGLHSFDTIREGSWIEGASVDQVFDPKACDAILDASFFEDLANDVLSSLAGVGDQTTMTNTLFIGKDLKKAELALGCYSAYSKAQNTYLKSTSTQDSSLNSRRDTTTQKLNMLNKRIDDLRAQQKASIKDVFKAIGVNFILYANQELTVKGVNSLIDKYGINGYLNTLDAIATQVYSLDYIQKNFTGDARQKMMVMSLFQNEKLGMQDKLKTAQRLANVKAQEFQIDSENLIWNNPDFYTKLASAGNENAFPQYQMIVGQEQAQQAIAAGEKAAYAEVLTGDGFKSQRNCTNVVEQEKQIDQEAKRLGDNLETEEIALALLQLNPNTPKSELDEANSKYQQAKNAFNQMPQRVNGGVVKSCELIDRPAQFLADGTGKYLEKWLRQSSDIKQENIPLYGRLISKVAEKFFKGVIEGKKPGQVLNEIGGGFANAAAGSSSQGLINALGQQSQNPVGSGNGGGGNNVPPVNNGPFPIYLEVAGVRQSSPATIGRNVDYNVILDLTSLKSLNPEYVTLSYGDGALVPGSRINLRGADNKIKPEFLKADGRVEVLYEFNGYDRDFSILGRTYLIGDNQPLVSRIDVKIGDVAGAFTSIFTRADGKVIEKGIKPLGEPASFSALGRKLK